MEAPLIRVLPYDDEGRKKCRVCGEFKSTDLFYRHSNTKDGLEGSCKSCKPPQNPDYMRSYNLRTNYGMTVEDWEILFRAQDGKCKLCGEGDRPLHVDHDHRCCPAIQTCGACVRGLLCSPCNRFLGRVESAWGERALAYINRRAA